MAGALDGVRILDFTQMMAGPLCPSLLGDMGADVIKVEPPEGDMMRRTGNTRLAGESDLFLSVNRNKRSVVLDLKSTSGRSAAQALASTADVVVENFRPGTAQRLGVDYDQVRADNPEVIYCSVTGFGTEGPDRRRAALDPVIQALSGLMSFTGDDKSGPLCAGVPISDFVTPVFATVGILTALFSRERTGKGQRIDVSMVNASIFATIPRDMHASITNDTPPLLGNRHYQMVPYDAYETSDGRAVMVVAHNDKFFHAFARGIGCPEMIDDPRYATNEDRVRNREELEARIREQFLTDTLASWLERLANADAIFAPVRSLPEVFADPKVRREMLAEVEHPSAGRISVLANPIQLSGTPASLRRAPPLLGEHTQSVLGVDPEAAWEGAGASKSAGG